MELDLPSESYAARKESIKGSEKLTSIGVEFIATRYGLTIVKALCE